MPRHSARGGHARALLCLVVLVACSQGEITDTPILPEYEPSVGSPANEEIRRLTLDTYEASGQTVHPDVAFGDREALLAVTPYPGGDTYHENPSVFVPAGGYEWKVQDGGRNPIVRPEGKHLSDPDVVYDPDEKQWRVYYRDVGEENVIKLIRSRDRRLWGGPVVVARGPNHDIVSPAVVRRSADDWLMWSVASGAGCAGGTTSVEIRRSRDGIEWSGPETVSLSTPHQLHPWHLDVQWIEARSEYWALVNAKEIGSCTTPALYLATSTDGVAWTTHPTPVAERGVHPALNDIVYRSTFAYDAVSGSVTFWFSGATYDRGRYKWSTVTQRRPVKAVLARVSTRALTSVVRSRRPGVPPLMVGP
jgi:hypothetical protein